VGRSPHHEVYATRGASPRGEERLGAGGAREGVEDLVSRLVFGVDAQQAPEAADRRGVAGLEGVPGEPAGRELPQPVLEGGGVGEAAPVAPGPRHHGAVRPQGHLDLVVDARQGAALVGHDPVEDSLNGPRGCPLRGDLAATRVSLEGEGPRHGDGEEPLGGEVGGRSTLRATGQDVDRPRPSGVGRVKWRKGPGSSSS